MKHKPSYIKSIVFDFDGTLTKPGPLDFSQLKKPIGCPLDKPYLEFIENFPAPEKEKALAALEDFETKAAAWAEPNIGAEELIEYLRSEGHGISILSRNTFTSVKRALENFRHISMSYFDVIISRDDPVSPKPSGDGIRMAAQKMNTDIRQVMMVGDYILDTQAGRDAGVITVFIDNGAPPEFDPGKRDYTISYLDELRDIIRMPAPLPAER